MTFEIARAARQLLADDEAAPFRPVADRASEQCDRLLRHLSRLLGETGVQTLWRRAIQLARVTHPCLAPVALSLETEGCVALRDALKDQDPDVATDAFVAVLETLFTLLARLIGTGLVERLLAEVWPAVFQHSEKEAP